MSILSLTLFFWHWLFWLLLPWPSSIFHELFHSGSDNVYFGTGSDHCGPGQRYLAPALFFCLSPAYLDPALYFGPGHVYFAIASIMFAMSLVIMALALFVLALGLSIFDIGMFLFGNDPIYFGPAHVYMAMPLLSVGLALLISAQTLLIYAWCYVFWNLVVTTVVWQCLVWHCPCWLRPWLRLFRPCPCISSLDLCILTWSCLFPLPISAYAPSMMAVTLSTSGNLQLLSPLTCLDLPKLAHP